MKTTSRLRRLRDFKGSTVIFVAIAMVMLLAFAALAVDMGYLYVVRGELQNAADSGALAGAQVLYDDPTTTADIPGAQVYAGADTIALNYVTQNYSEKAQATVDGANGIQRGHWSFATRTFTPNDSLVPVDLFNVTAAELDANLNFINAVRVNTTRKRVGGQLPEHFFAKIFGGPRTEVKATAVAYIGFAGKLTPHSVDQPIAICKQAVTVDDKYSCGVGRMLNSGQNAGHQTAGWTNFVQPCSTASASDMKALICATGNPITLDLGQTVGTTNGTQTGPSYDGIRDDCWGSNPSLDLNHDGWPDQPWTITLPVIDCPDGSVGNCSDLVGAVEIKVVWMTRNDKNQMKEVPRLMGDWPALADPPVPIGTIKDVPGLCAGTGQACWDSFVKHFALQDVLNGTPAFYEDKTMYFLPKCTGQEPTGFTGGENFGILAKIPVLVK